MKFVKCNLYKAVPRFDELTRERLEDLQLVKSLDVKIVTRTQNEIEEGFVGIFPKLNGYTTEKNIIRGDIIEDIGESVKYRVQRVDPVPRLTSLYLELM